ncbi:unnamed protein product [Hydatigera taeniaeformis]|uniref:MORN repeat-containing protein 3 n=1 Tax=Hydatigena taeniaeformis TaxID=6205 RepID=A0A158REY6_HYDTA|nr:unnamed protein product [Hydatigera taeniaeformis]
MIKNWCLLTPSRSQEILAKTRLNGIRKTIYSVNGDSYTGEWKDNKKHGTFPSYGYGENWYSCNEFYEGEWYENKRSGWGRYYYKDGAMYEGEWLHDKRWGNGMLRLPNENRYEGGWIDDMKNGKGKYIFHTTNQVMEGIWIDDVAKQAIFTDLGPRMEKTETTYPIPSLELQSWDAVWRDTAEDNMRLLQEKYPQISM